MRTPTTTGSPEESKTTEEPLICNPSLATKLNFEGSSIMANNLGGQGPSSGAEMLLYVGIASHEGSAIDLVVTAQSSYEAADSSLNGVNGNHGQINVRSGTYVELLFRFVKGATNTSVELPEFYFTLLDIDQSDARHPERYYISGFEGIIKEDINDFEEEVLTDGRTLFKSLVSGNYWDSPRDPMNLGVVANPEDDTDLVDQRKRAVVAVFRNTSQFTVAFEVPQAPREVQLSGGRNFIFAGKSNLVDDLCPSRVPAPPGRPPG